MRRRSALPESAANVQAGAARCSSCDSANAPAFLCPTCPKRETRNVALFDHGWVSLRKADPALAQVLERNARAARQLAITHPSHPAYAEIDREYVMAGMELMAYRAASSGYSLPKQTVEHMRREDAKCARWLR